MSAETGGRGFVFDARSPAAFPAFAAASGTTLLDISAVCSSACIAHVVVPIRPSRLKAKRRQTPVLLPFHELRHTQATLLIGSGADIKTVQHRLGHSSASLTMNIYAHAIEQNDRDAADRIGGLLG